MAVSPSVIHSPRLPSTTFPLTQLPNEVLHMVFAQLTDTFKSQDIASLRLVCQRFADIGGHYLLSEANLFFKTSQFEHLRRISEHPIISQNVDTLFYEADTLDSYRSVEDWKRNVCVPNWTSVTEKGLRKLPRTATERDRRAYKRNMKRTLLDKVYNTYARHLSDQETIRAHDYNVEILKDLMARMKNLKTIEMSTACCLNNGRTKRMERAFKDGLSLPYGDRQNGEGCGVGQLRSLLLAADAAGLELDMLCAGYVSWRFFMDTEKHKIDDFRKMQGAVRSLRTLKFHVSASSVYEDYASFQGFAQALSQCAKYLHETPHLRNFVTATPDLERLDINFISVSSRPLATLCDIVGVFEWHALRVAAFSGISADEDCLAHFFDRHASTLRKIRLDTIFLDTGSWPSLLQRARKALQLEQAVLCGWLRSNHPEEYHNFDFPAGLQGGKKAKIGVVVEEYLLKGGDGPWLDLKRLVKEHKGAYINPEEGLGNFMDTESDEYIMDRF